MGSVPVAQALPPGFQLDPLPQGAAPQQPSAPTQQQQLPPGFVPDSPPAPQPETRSAQAPRSWMDEIGHDLNFAGTKLNQGIADVIGLPRAAGDALRPLALKVPPPSKDPTKEAVRQAMLREQAFSASPPLAPTSANVQDLMFNKAGLPKVEADTTLGKIAGTGIEAIPAAALNPGNFLRSIVPMFASGAASEAGGQATAGTAAEGPTRLALGMLAPGAMAIPGMIRSSTGGLIRDMTREMTPVEWADAMRLHGAGRDIGVPLTGAEATGNTGLLSMQRQAERAAGDAGTTMRRFMAGRPAQVAARGDAALAQVGPHVHDVPAASANIQRQALGVISDAEGARTAATSPSYQAAEGAPFTGGRELLDAINAQIDKGGAQPVVAQLTTLRDHLVNEMGRPDGPRIGALDSIRKYWRDKIALPDVSAEATPKEANAKISPILGQLRDTMSRENPDFAYGRALHEQISRDVVQPLTEGAPGNLARANSVSKQIASIADPNTARPATIRQVISGLRMRDPQAARDLVRLHLENSFNQANTAIVSGPNQMGGAKFNVAVAGSPQQAANIQAAIRALPNGDAVWRGFRRMLDVFQATGRRFPVGSMTDENQAARAALKDGGVAGVVGAVAKPLGRIKQFAEDLRYGRNSAEMARVLTDPNSVALMRRLAIEAPQGAKAQGLVLSLIGAVDAKQREGMP